MYEFCIEKWVKSKWAWIRFAIPNRFTTWWVDWNRLSLPALIDREVHDTGKMYYYIVEQPPMFFPTYQDVVIMPLPVAWAESSPKKNLGTSAGTQSRNAKSSAWIFSPCFALCFKTSAGMDKNAMKLVRVVFCQRRVLGTDLTAWPIPHTCNEWPVATLHHSGVISANHWGLAFVPFLYLPLFSHQPHFHSFFVLFLFSLSSF